MRSTSKDDLVVALRSLSIPDGSAVLCHSQLTGLGRMEGGSSGVVEAFLSVLGPTGTLVVPTFTYSAFAGEVFDVDQTPSTVGELGNVVRNWPGATRSWDPNFSHAAIGPMAKTLMAWNGEPSLGEGSFYHRFSEANGLIVLLGVDFRSLPVFMHMERLLDMPYREDKRFAGVVRSEGLDTPVVAIHAVRNAFSIPNTNRSRIGSILDQQPSCRHARLGGADLRAIPIGIVESTVRAQVEADPLILLDEKTPFITRAEQ